MTAGIWIKKNLRAPYHGDSRSKLAEFRYFGTYFADFAVE